jgi:hypothetical protein
MSATIERIVRRRLVLEVCHGCADAQTMRTAAQFASMLGLGLHGLFIEDTTILALAELQFVREIRLPTYEWRAIDAERMQAELRHTAAEARRMLNEVAAAIGVPNAFEVVRGDPGEMIAATLSADDVVVLAAPTNAGTRLAPGFTHLYEAVDRSAASVLLLPVGFAPRHGSVVALLNGPDDPSLIPAAQIAVRAREKLLLVLPQGGEHILRNAEERAVALGVPWSHITTRRLSALRAEDVLDALGHARDRLIVVTRHACPAGGIVEASRIAADRGVPVLLVAPDQAGHASSGGTIRTWSSTTVERGVAGSSKVP